MPVMPAELRLEMPVSMEMQVMPAERKVEREYEVRITISGGKMEEVDEAPHDIENQKDPLLEEVGKLSPLSPLRCIYRVPKRLRQGNKEAYTPQVVSIGPLHHGEEPLKGMEEHKLRYLQSFLDRTGVSCCDYIQMIKNQEGRLRGFYAEFVELGSDEFVRIVLVDAAFVIVFLLRHYYIYASSSQGEDDYFQGEDGEDDYFQGEDDYIFNNPGMLEDVIPDLWLLENQLPFFILQDLFKRFSSSSSHQLPSLLKISYHLFESEIDGRGKVKNFAKICYSGEEVQHFVDLIRILYLPPETTSTSETTDTPKTTWCDRMLVRSWCDRMLVRLLTCGYTPTDKPNATATPNVTELHQAGVKFVVGEGSSVFDIKFSGGILEIPKLRVDDTTDLKLRNILAFEQCHHREEYYLANYVFLMKRLVKIPKDVQLLVEKGIIENWLGDTQKICTLLHDLGTGMTVDNRDLTLLCNDLIEYREKPWHEWKVILKQKYFNTPWACLSFVAAATILILTIIQTACSIVSVA
ncbi:UPF0481 protein At3g47200-like isoform X2 [Malus domestica]